ncbi:MAG: hypothetical protein HYV65_02490 [Candidatus Spechtbacteria bacterium]|nr:hypothetical protein [Candidatus Spechtbacteria bacterium]
MNMEFIIPTIIALISLIFTGYQHYQENRLRGKIKSWLEMSRGLHAASRNKGVEEVSNFANSLVKDIEDEYSDYPSWKRFIFFILLIAIGAIIGLIVSK